MRTPSASYQAGTEPDELLTVTEIVAELKVSRRTFYRWRELRIGPEALKLPNGEIRVSRRALRDWLDHLSDNSDHDVGR